MSVFFLGGCSETENELGSINNDKGELESSYKIQINHFDSEPVSKNECKLKYKDVGYSVKFVPALDFLERKGTKVEKEDLPSLEKETVVMIEFTSLNQGKRSPFDLEQCIYDKSKAIEYFAFQLEKNIMITQNDRSEEHTSELQSRPHLVCRLLLEK